MERLPANFLLNADAREMALVCKQSYSARRLAPR